MKCRICKNQREGRLTLISSDHEVGPICNECAEFKELLIDFIKACPALTEGSFARLYREARLTADPFQPVERER